jgi:hypothetical protein
MWGKSPSDRIPRLDGHKTTDGRGLHIGCPHGGYAISQPHILFCQTTHRVFPEGSPFLSVVSLPRRVTGIKRIKMRLSLIRARLRDF